MKALECHGDEQCIGIYRYNKVWISFDNTMEELRKHLFYKDHYAYLEKISSLLKASCLTLQQTKIFITILFL